MSEDDFKAQIFSSIRNMIERLARIEERQRNHAENVVRLSGQIDRLEAKAIEIERDCSLYSASVCWLERAVWLLGAVGAWAINEWLHLPPL